MMDFGGIFMKFIIEKDYFTEAINHVSKAVSSKTTISILTGIKIELKANGLALTASDADISIQCFIPLDEGDKKIIHVETIGSVVVPAKYFFEIIRKLPQPKVEIEIGERWLTTIRSGQSEFKLNGLDPEEFPRLPQLSEDRVFSISSQLLRSMIKQTVFAVSTVETRPVLTGVLWSLNEGRFKMVATDSHRLATREALVEANDPLSFQNVVVPGKSLNELNKILQDDDSIIDIVVTDNQILVKSADVLFYTRLLDGTYPDTSRIIPQSSKTEMIVPAKLFLDSIERASLLAKDGKTNIVKLATIGEKTIEISSNIPEVGRVTEQVEVRLLDGEELQISFNAKFMIDTIRAIDASEILIGFTGAMSPFIIKPVENEWMLYLILPVRTY
jgi:DNA polymerase-3 subunit beta